jgi:hypothetical protein
MAISIPATSSTRVKHGLLIKLVVNGTDYFIANTYGPVTYLGNTYLGLGHFLGMDQIQDDLKATNNGLQISLSGIPKAVGEEGLPGYSSYVAFILDQRIKGSLIQIYRVFFDLETNAIIENSVSQRFSGYISNFSITDGIDLEAKDNSKTVVITCSSVNSILERKITGRRTNQADQRALYPNDSSMDRVAIISNTAFDFGKPYTGGGTGGGSGSETNYNDIREAG